MTLQIERIPTLNDNYTYLVICESTRKAAIVDAPEEAPVVARVEATGARVTHILSTHHHPDHAMANPKLAERYGAPVYGHQSDADRLAGFTHGLEEGDTIEIGEAVARVLFIPCHTSGHVAYYFADDHALFSGDMLFASGCGRFFEGTAEMMYAALCEKLAALPDETRVYCGHEYTESNLRFAVHVEPERRELQQRLEEVQAIRSHAAADWHDATPEEMTVPSTLAMERVLNPFMRARDAEEMGRLRSMKDNF